MIPAQVQASEHVLYVQEFHKLVSPKTKLISLVHISNALGSVLDTQQVREAAQKVCHIPLAILLHKMGLPGHLQMYCGSPSSCFSASSC